MEQDNLEQTSITESQLSVGNQAKWANVPGDYNYNVQWDHYLYPNSNYLETLYNNVAPTFSMEGPYVYSEVDAYTDQVYEVDTDLVSSVLNQSTVYVSDPGNLDTPMWLANQGAMKKWYSMTNQAWWRAYMGVLYNVVNYWQGEYLMKLTVFQHMQSSYFNSASDINTFLLINNPATLTVESAMFTDPYYGLYNYNNYAQWSVLQSSDVSTAAVREKLAFQAELRTYFGLTSA